MTLFGACQGTSHQANPGQGDSGPISEELDAAALPDAAALDLVRRETPPPAPPNGPIAPWASKDIGAVGMQREEVRSSLGVMAVRSGGMDVGGTADSFQYLSQKVRGDFELVARVRSLQMVDPDTKAGIMVRANDTDAGAANVFLAVLGDPMKGGVFQYRPVAAGPTTPGAPDTGVRAGQWLRITRKGRTFSAYRSANRLNGTYYHYMLRMEHMDDDFIKRAYGKGTPGDLFKSVGGRWDEGPYGYSDERPLEPYCGYTIDQRYEANYERSTNEDWKSGGAEVRQLIEDLAAARTAGLPAVRKFFADNFDLAALTTYLAVINWMVAWDDQYHNHYLYKRPDGRWIMLPTDMDNVMGGAPPSLADASFFTGQFNVRSNRNDYWSYLKDAFLRAYRAEFIARVVELDRTVLAPDQVSALVDQLTAPYRPDEALLSPAGVSCGLAADAIQRLKDFAYARSARVAAALFD